MSPLAKHSITGPDAERFVDYLIPRDATRLAPGQAYFTPWCNEDGVQVGDGIVMRLERDRFVFSADRMMRWFARHAPGFDVEFEDLTDDFGILALQGPLSRNVLASASGEDHADLRFSRLRRTTIAGVEVLLSRQGFTGELGFELWVPRAAATTVWDAVFEAGAAFGLVAAGLHAADVARIEAGMVIPGYDYTPAAIDPTGSLRSTPPVRRSGRWRSHTGDVRPARTPPGRRLPSRWCRRTSGRARNWSRGCRRRAPRASRRSWPRA